MLGVTLFGIFLTPVFYYVIQWVSDKRGGPRRREEADSPEAEGSHGDGVAHGGDGQHHPGPHPVPVHGEPALANGHGHGNGDGNGHVGAQPQTTHAGH
jgi:hypothetical protein